MQVFLEKEGDDHCVLQFTSHLVLQEWCVLAYSFLRNVLSLLSFPLLVFASKRSFRAWTHFAVSTVVVIERVFLVDGSSTRKAYVLVMIVRE